MPPKIDPTDVPPIFALRQALNYSDAESSECRAFDKELETHRKEFTAASGLVGNDLHQWKTHQADLGEMSRAFLERSGNGQRFWPSDKRSPHYNGLRYSSNHAKIKRILKQLFWRMNLQDLDGTGYTKEEPGERNSNNQSGMTPGDAIDLDLIVEGSSTLPLSELRGSARSATIPSLPIQPSPSDANIVDSPILGSQQHPSFMQELDKDPYQLPESPKSGIPIPRKRPISATTRAAAVGKARRSVSYSEDEPRAKRARKRYFTSTRTLSASREHDESHAEVLGHKMSPRRRKPRHNPDMATPEQLAAVFESPEHFSSPAVSGDIEAAGPAAEPLSNEPLRSSVEDPFEDEFMNTYISRITKELNGELGLHTTGIVPQSTGTNTAPLAQMVPENSALTPSFSAKTSSILPSPAPASPTVSKDWERKDSTLHVDKMPAMAPPATKPRVEFVYRVITRQPAYRGDPWVPAGSFRNKTISELETEIPIRVGAADLIGLRFVLLHVGSETRAEQIIPRGHEQRFTAAKRYFDRVIRSCIARTGNGNQALIEFEIEALTDEKPVIVDAFEEAFDW